MMEKYVQFGSTLTYFGIIINNTFEVCYMDFWHFGVKF